MDNSRTLEIDGHCTSEKDSGKTEGGEGRKNIVPLYKLFQFADPLDVVLMILGVVAAIANGFSLPLMSLLVGDLTDAFGETADRSNVVREVLKVCLRFVYLGVGSAAASFFQLACWMVTGERQSARIRNLYLKSILRQDISFFDMQTDAGQVVGRMSGDIVLIQDAMGEKVGKSIQLLSTFVGGFVIAFIRGWLLTLVMVAIVPFLVISGAFMSVIINKLATRGEAAYSEAAAVVEQTIYSIKTVVSFTGERRAVEKYNKSLETAYKTSVQEGFVSGVGLGMVMFIVFCSYALAVWFGSLMILEKGYTGGDVINVLFTVVTSSMALGEASPCMKAFAAAQAAAFDMFETINRRPYINSFDRDGCKLDDLHGDIELKDVYFSYPSRPKEQIFAGFSLSIPSGTTTALVGESGSGKSTVISLIERFYDPQAGEVLIDGINLKEFQLQWIRGKIGLVSQEPILFASSIKDNIAYGKDDSTLEEIQAAAELANASIFIDKMPQGLDTMVGESGSQLSGGQKQRIAIARAILKDPRILLLDEATSALDSESERVVQEALDRVMTNRTTIVVAHRLSTVRNSNIIAVIQEGNIVEKGSHSELLNLHGAYNHLVSMQEVTQGSGKECTTDQGKADNTLDSQINSDYCLSSGECESTLPSPGSPSMRMAALNIEQTVPEILNSLGTLEKSPEVPLHRLAYLNKPELPILILGSISAIIKGSILPVFGLLFSIIIRIFYEPPKKLGEDSRFWLWMFIVMGSVAWIASIGMSFFFGIAGSRLIKRVRSMTFKKVVHREMRWFDNARNSSSMIGARLSLDATAVRSMVGDALGLFVQNCTSVIFGLIIAINANWLLSLIVVGLLPLLGFNAWVYMKFTKGFSADAKIMYEEASQVANDAIRNIRTVASFCAEENVIELYRKKCEGPQKTGIRLAMITGTGFGLSFFFLYSSYAISFYAGARLVEDGKTTFSLVFRVFFALAMAATGVSHASSLVPDATRAKASTASIFALLDSKSEIDSSDNSGMILENVNGDIEFQHVSFTYPTRPDVKILQDLCLNVKSGKTFALVGESGCGKSTVISLLQRFYSPDSGKIMLDGIEIQNFMLRWLRQQMGLVSQEPILFNESIRVNIAYGKEGAATEAEISAAAKAANAHNFISGMQQGYDTLVGEHGIQLSGGQKQRIAIARAILKAPKILLLDEATSALDAESERVVQDALEQVTVGRTTIVVAHRLATIKGVDMLAVIRNGIIVEKGRHADLIGIKDGFYASLVALHMDASSQ